MKKTYINPEMVIVKIETMGMLANSVTAPVSDVTQDNGDALAPELPGIPPFVFE